MPTVRQRNVEAVMTEQTPEPEVETEDEMPGPPEFEADAAPQDEEATEAENEDDSDDDAGDDPGEDDDPDA